MMRVAISQRVIDAAKGAKRDGLEQDYIQHYSGFGIILIPIPNVLDDVAAYLDALGIERIILSGGNDINPSLYGAAPEGVDYADERDATERQLLDYAIARRIPVLCECRGMQFLNVYCGGKLRKVQGHVGAHTTTIDGREVEVNSYHNLGFTAEDLGEGLAVFATADEVIEGVRHTKHPIAGIMWHPEREQPSDAARELDERLIRDFLDGRGYWA